MKFKRLSVFFLLVACSLLLVTSEAISRDKHSDKDWYPFVLSRKLDPDSPANIGKLVLDAPAGKHGFLKTKGDSFIFTDGTPAKFWGTNLCFSACFPSKEQAEFMADRLAFFGFNAVRLHHMDFYFEPEGIFKDIAPAFKHPHLKETGHLSEKQLDKLDYLIFQLKKRGIYMNMNLLVSRHFTEADGVIDAEELGMAAKPISMFDEDLIWLQKEYARDLLTHYNPYTKLKYTDDPAICMVEITNENSINQYWKQNKLNSDFFGLKNSSIPEYYLNQLDYLWNKGLREEYGDIEKLHKSWHGTKQSQVTSRKSQEKAEAKNLAPMTKDENIWEVEKHANSRIRVTQRRRKTILNVKYVTATPWHLQYKVPKIKVEKGKKYLFSFTASSSKPLTMGIVAQKSSAPWTNLGLTQSISLTRKQRIFTFPFAPEENCDNAKLAFLVGYGRGKITLQDVQLQEIENLPVISSEAALKEFKFHRPLYRMLGFYPKKQQQDIKDFYIGLTRKYFEEMSDFLKDDCGVKVPITGIGGYTEKEDLLASTPCDFIDVHTYWDHPRFPNKPWDKDDFRIHNKSMLLDQDFGMIGSIKKRTVAGQVKKNRGLINPSLKNKPFTITEWNHCYPNQFAYETPVFLATEALKGQWDALFQFALKHHEPEFRKIDAIDSYFDILSNPQQLLLNSLASLTYFKEKKYTFDLKDGVYKIIGEKVIGATGNIKDQQLELGPKTVNPTQNGAVFMYPTVDKPINETSKIMLLALSEVKNKKSGWKKDRFNWGVSPTLLNKMDAGISIQSTKKIKVHALDDTGKPRRKIKVKQKEGIATFSTSQSKSPWFLITLD